MNTLFLLLVILIQSTRSTDSDYISWLMQQDNILKIPSEPTIESLQFPVQVDIKSKSVLNQCRPSVDRTSITGGTYAQRCYNVSCIYPSPQPLSHYHIPFTLNSGSLVERSLESECGFLIEGKRFCQLDVDQPSLDLAIQSENDSYTLMFSMGVNQTSLGWVHILKFILDF